MFNWGKVVTISGSCQIRVTYLEIHVFFSGLEYQNLLNNITRVFSRIKPVYLTRVFFVTKSGKYSFLTRAKLVFIYWFQVPPAQLNLIKHTTDKTRLLQIHENN